MQPTKGMHKPMAKEEEGEGEATKGKETSCCGQGRRVGMCALLLLLLVKALGHRHKVGGTQTTAGGARAGEGGAAAGHGHVPFVVNYACCDVVGPDEYVVDEYGRPNLLLFLSS